MPEWTWERWQWSDTPHFPKLQHYCSHVIRLFCVILRTLVVGVLLLCRERVGVLFSPSRLGHNWTAYWFILYVGLSIYLTFTLPHRCSRLVALSKLKKRQRALLFAIAWDCRDEPMPLPKNINMKWNSNSHIEDFGVDNDDNRYAKYQRYESLYQKRTH